MRKFFGTDGVRGVANIVLTPELAFRLGKAAGFVITKSSPKKNKPVFVVGRDTRISGTMLESALNAGIASSGVDVIQLGVLPTPAVSLITKTLADGGAMISASHNPFEDNGIKFFDQNGFKLPDQIELEIEYFLENPNELPLYKGEQLGIIKSNPEKDFSDIYKSFLKKSIDDLDLSELKLVIDCANGAASKIAPELFESLGADVHIVSAEPDGININVECGSTYPINLKKKVLEVNADLGLAYDGDADRLIAIDEKGNIVDGDQILYICANHLKENGKLKNNKIAATVMSNFGFKKALNHSEIDFVETNVGDRYVLEEMIKSDISLGGEQSGHIIFLDLISTGDGVLTSLQLASILKMSGVPFSTLLEGFIKYPQYTENVRVSNKKAWEENEQIQLMIKKYQEELMGTGRLLIRASGTENLVRVMVEGQNEDRIKKIGNNISVEIKNCS